MSRSFKSQLSCFFKYIFKKLRRKAVFRAAYTNCRNTHLLHFIYLLQCSHRPFSAEISYQALQYFLLLSLCHIFLLVPTKISQGLNPQDECAIQLSASYQEIFSDYLNQRTLKNYSHLKNFIAKA